MYTITVTAPTTYQSNAVRYFGLGLTNNLNGSITASRNFETFDEAESHLINVLTEKHEGGEEEADYIEAMYEIINLGQLSFDGLTAYITEA